MTAISFPRWWPFCFVQTKEFLFREAVTMTTRLTLTNLDMSTTVNDLHGLFNNSGLVMSMGIHPIQKHDSTQTGWVDMSSVDSAEAAVKALNGYTLRDRQINVSIT
jgi:hypothetical protein